MDEIGLFPLPLVLLPGEHAPLHIFEPRYKELIGECLEDEVDFGLVLADDEGMRQIGTRAAVVEVLERFPDGRLNIVVEGRDRFRLVELTEGRSFATAEVDDVEDEGEDPTESERERCLAAYDRVVTAADAELEELDRDGDDLAFQIAARIDLGTEAKQDLLELRSERERIVLLAGLLERAAEAVARDREIKSRAASNGRVEAL
ncbi:MAG: LON peptidase substrate-binding domain-containing protein [Actinomycetota bacterium]|nr:LON peptidase substrate-binding domain-containing protein [Actinomycetota bacterium]